MKKTNHIELEGGKEKMEKISCPKCKYEWETNSEMLWVTCPHCMRKFEKNPSTNENDKKD